MTADFFQQLELPSSIARTPKNAETPFTMLDNRTVQADIRLAGLKRGDKEIHTILMSLPDNWDFKHIARWVAEKQGFSTRTAFRIIGRLLDAGLMARTEDEDTERWGYQIFEVPCENRPTGAAARERHVISGRKARHQYFQRAPRAPRKCRGLLEVDNPGPAFLGPKRGVTNLTHRQTTNGNVLHSSEHSGTPLSPVGESGILDELRVSRNEGKPAKTARGAKRRKGRSAPGRPRNKRKRKSQPSRKPRVPLLSRAAINLGEYTAKADAAEFMQNLPTLLPAAIEDLKDLPPERSQAWVDRLMANPLVAVMQDVAGYDAWGHSEMRSFANSIGRRIPVADLLLLWTGVTGPWCCDTVADIRWRLRESRPTAADTRRVDGVNDRIEEIYNWQRHADLARERISEQCNKAVNEMLAGVDLEDPSSVEEHPFLWTAILASPEWAEGFLSAEVIEFARRTLVPVEREEFAEWVDSRSERMMCRWHGSFCSGEFEVLVGRGISAILDEKLPPALRRPSGYGGFRDYRRHVDARTAVIPMFES